MGIDLGKKTISLEKRQRISLTKQAEGLAKVTVGLGWDPVKRTKESGGFFKSLFGGESNCDVDLDAWAILMGRSNVISKGTLCYYGNTNVSSSEGIVMHHHGDNLTGDGDGDDEQISIDLEAVPEEFDKILIGVTIYQGRQKGQSLGMVENTFVRIVDERNGFEICRYNQADMKEKPDANSFIAGLLTRVKGEWIFEALGRCTDDKDIREAILHYEY